MTKMSKKKAAILEAATVLFANKGFADTSMNELASMTGVAEGTIFYHFTNKEQLLLTILSATRDSILEEFNAHMEEREFKTGMEMMEEVVVFYLLLAGRMEYQFLLLHRLFIYQLAESRTEFRENLEAIYNCLVTLFEQAIFMGQEDGSIGDVNPRKSALIVFTMVDGLVRFKNFNLYDAGALFNELIESVRRMLKPN
ncbi:TetR/AcrR family transcriptional regulator [Maridesulfovibrio ferrireducens]|uniref:Transcriptional regulator, TetR family n=1 Tax=Maridesulfovibrio ferrireducens TaxID=246191 RepID=A0A1G9FCA0_9BACT|nr:TetR/AcrR family transcriptional regulator [Maridesulfovibrio ferrireducens]MBI9110916.1 TetR/AcrR family transcriptional regulator [Maridesulfovibrio ferrireducens]SDK85966.1 transcriptional regulator, TetR family [Maridesulfovibrio ferrireducens]